MTKLAVEELAIHFRRPITVNEDGCWLWLGTITGGYATFGAARVYGIVWRMAGNECTPGKELCHRYNVKSCINPDHMYEGTHKQNMEDASKAGVMGSRIVTDENARQIFQMLDGGLSLSKIAKVFGVCKATISHIKQGRYQYANSIKPPK